MSILWYAFKLLYVDVSASSLPQYSLKYICGGNRNILRNYLQSLVLMKRNVVLFQTTFIYLYVCVCGCTKEEKYTTFTRYAHFQVTYKEGTALGFIDHGFVWKNLRKSFHSAVKMYGTGLHDLEVLLADILEELVERIEKKPNQAFVIEDDIYKAILASMWVMVRYV